MMIYIKREEEQDTSYIEELADEFRSEGEYTADPIVVVGDEILDGHHRAEAALLAGVEVEAVAISADKRGELTEAGYDDTEIAAAAHVAAKNYDAANNINIKFGGIVLGRAEEAAELI